LQKYGYFLAILLISFSCTSLKIIKHTDKRMEEIRLNHVPFEAELDMDFLLYFPDDYTPDKNWPLLVFLHGIGERGDDLEKVKVHGPPKRIEQGYEYPFIVAAPQCPADSRWSVSKLDNWLTWLLTQLPVDKKRIYLTGLSMGGLGTWAWAADQPDRFAAIAPVCGGGEVRSAEMLTKLPIWAFHGALDPVIPISRSQEMIDAISALGGNVQFTIYHDATHDSWTKTYDNPELVNWFLKHHK
jgi:predicted peptidase